MQFRRIPEAKVSCNFFKKLSDAEDTKEDKTCLQDRATNQSPTFSSVITMINIAYDP